MASKHSPLTRRMMLGALAGSAALAALPQGAQALTLAQARSLVDSVVGEINTVIASGQSEAQMLKSFERIFARYADVRYIAQSALGPAGRSVSGAQMDAYVRAYQGYISRKYGRRFREFIGGSIEVTDAHPLKSFFEVTSLAHLKGQAPFEVRWHVFDKSGKDLFFNLIIEGVNMLASERTEMGALLDQRGGDLDTLIADLKTL